MPAAVTYTTFGNTIVAENRGGVLRDYMRDPLGSTVGLIDSTQTITDTFEYWPYGEIRSQTGSTGTPFTFVGTLGYFLDAATSFSYVRARILMTALARWLTVDALWPHEFAYAYVEGRPEIWADPSGKQRLACQYLLNTCVQGRLAAEKVLLLLATVLWVVLALLCAAPTPSQAVLSLRVSSPRASS